MADNKDTVVEIVVVKCADSLTIQTSITNPGPTPTLAHLEMAYTGAILKACHGNKAAAARLLGISRRSLYRLLDKAAATELQKAA